MSDAAKGRDPSDLARARNSNGRQPRRDAELRDLNYTSSDRRPRDTPQQTPGRAASIPIRTRSISGNAEQDEDSIVSRVLPQTSSTSNMSFSNHGRSRASMVAGNGMENRFSSRTIFPTDSNLAQSSNYGVHNSVTNFTRSAVSTLDPQGSPKPSEAITHIRSAASSFEPRRQLASVDQRLPTTARQTSFRQDSRQSTADPRTLAQVERFVDQVPFNDMDQCAMFFEDHPIILEDPGVEGYLMDRAKQALVRDNQKLVKTCVEKALMVKLCRELSQDRLAGFFRQLHRDQRVVREFDKQFDDYLEGFRQSNSTELTRGGSDQSNTLRISTLNTGDQPTRASFSVTPGNPGPYSISRTVQHVDAAPASYSRHPNMPPAQGSGAGPYGPPRQDYTSQAIQSSGPVTDAPPSQQPSRYTQSTGRIPSEPRSQQPSRMARSTGAIPSEPLSQQLMYHIQNSAPTSYRQLSLESTPQPVRYPSLDTDTREIHKKRRAEDTVVGLSRTSETITSTNSVTNQITTLDHSWLVRPSHWFEPGRVFAILFHESVPETLRSQNWPTASAIPDTVVNRFGVPISSSIRRFIVVKSRDGYCLTLPISAYGGRGLSRAGLSRQDIEAHAVIYDAKNGPPTPSNGPQSSKRPISMHLNRGTGLPASSVINFAKIYTVEHDVKVKDIGSISRESMRFLMTYWQAQMTE